jgi:hypothetical protein
MVSESIHTDDDDDQIPKKTKPKAALKAHISKFKPKRNLIFNGQVKEQPGLYAYDL